MASLRYAEDGEIELKREDGRRHPFEFDSVYKHADGQVEKRSFHCLYLRYHLLKHGSFADAGACLRGHCAAAGLCRGRVRPVHLRVRADRERSMTCTRALIWRISLTVQRL